MFDQSLFQSLREITSPCRDGHLKTVGGSMSLPRSTRLHTILRTPCTVSASKIMVQVGSGSTSTCLSVPRSRRKSRSKQACAQRALDGQHEQRPLGLAAGSETGGDLPIDMVPKPELVGG